VDSRLLAGNGLAQGFDQLLFGEGSTVVFEHLLRDVDAGHLKNSADELEKLKGEIRAQAPQIVEATMKDTQGGSTPTTSDNPAESQNQT